MEHCKLQISCMLIILYIVLMYKKECKRYRQKHKFSTFDAMLAVGIFRLFVYMLSITAGLLKTKSGFFLMYSPLVVNILVVVVNMPNLQYIEGKVSNYSMGMSAYTCFAMATIYIIASIVIFFSRWRYIEKHKRFSILTYLLLLAGITAYQMFHPQALVTGLCTTLIILGVYLNQENPAVTELGRYHEKMTMGFATLVENKDGSTGGHIKRTTMYVRLLAEELRRRGYYREVLTKDYVRYLCMAAPMHDIGRGIFGYPGQGRRNT